MFGEILLAANDLFFEDPEKIVRELRRQAKEGATLSLILYPQGWAQPDRLIFSRDSISRTYILLCEGGTKKRVWLGRCSAGGHPHHPRSQEQASQDP
jgi:hypothetical protein